jgi:hypothetical protein
MKSKHLLLVLLVVFGMVGCKNTEEPKILFVNQEMLPYCWFPKGSYWIYEEENTPGRIDSVYVKSTWISIEPEESQEGYRAEYYGSTLMLRGKLFGQGRRPWPLSTTLDESFTEFTEGYSDSSGSADDIVLFWNPSNPSVLPSYPGALTLNHLDAIEILGKKYYDAYDVNHTLQSIVGHTRRVVWVRNVGVVRREMQDGTNWSLVRYHVD